MKPLVLLVAISGMLAPAWAQQLPEHPNGVQRIQLDCRDPATSGRALQPDEMLEEIDGGIHARVRTRI